MGGGQAGANERFGTILRPDVHQLNHFHVEFDDDESRVVKTELRPSLRHPSGYELAARGEWKLTDDSKLVIPRDDNGVPLPGSHCWDCMYFHCQFVCPSCTPDEDAPRPLRSNTGPIDAAGRA